MAEQDLNLLINNLQGTVNNLQSSFTNIQSTISSLNTYDSTFNTTLNQKLIDDGLQDGKLSALQVIDEAYGNKISILEGKFPLKNADVLDESINKAKIVDLEGDLTVINNNISSNLSALNAQKIKQANENLEINTLLTTQKTKQTTDNTTTNNRIDTLLNSTVGTTSNPFQISIDSLNNKRIINEAQILESKNKVAVLESDNTTNKADLVVLKADNTINKTDIVNEKAKVLELQNDVITLENFTTDEAAKLSAQINKEATDVLTINTNVNTLSATVASNYNILDTKITTIDDREQADNQAIKTDILTKYNDQQSKNTTFEGQITSLTTNQTTNNTTLTNSLNTLDAKHDADKVILQNQITNNLNANNAHFFTNDSLIDTNKIDIVNIKSDILTEKAKVEQLEIDVPANKNEIDLLKVDNVANKAKLLLHTNNLLSIETNLSNNAGDITVLNNDVSALKAYDIQNTINLNTNDVKVNNNINDISTIVNSTIPNLDNKFLIKSGDSMSGALLCNDLDFVGTLNIGKSSTNINIGNELNEDIKVINIGGVNDIVNIKGNLNNINTTNMEVENKLISLNKGAVGNIQSGSVGIQIRDNDLDSKGYIVTNAAADEYHFKMPQVDQVIKMKKNPTELYDLATKLYVDAQNEVQQAELTSIQAAQLDLANQVSTVNNNVLAEIPFSKLNAFPSDNTKVLFGDGVFRAVTAVNGQSNEKYRDVKFISPLPSAGITETILNFGNYSISLNGSNNNYPYITSNLSIDSVVHINNVFVNAVNGGSFYGQAIKRNLSTQSNGAWNTTNISSVGLDISQQYKCTLYDETNDDFYKIFIILLTKTNGHKYLAYAEKF
jgi:hypothetical protein